MFRVQGFGFRVGAKVCWAASLLSLFVLCEGPTYKHIKTSYRLYMYIDRLYIYICLCILLFIHLFIYICLFIYSCLHFYLHLYKGLYPRPSNPEALVGPSGARKEGWDETLRYIREVWTSKGAFFADLEV